MEDIGGKPLSQVVEVLANISRLADVIMTRWVVMIPAAWPVEVSCQRICDIQTIRSSLISKVYQGYATATDRSIRTKSLS